MPKDTPISIPSIRGRIAEKLAKSSPRIDDGDDELGFPDDPGEIVLSRADERGVVALACLILENLREHGGTRAPKRALENVLRKTLASFGPKEVMDIEVEAYEILAWLGRAADPQFEEAEGEETDGTEPDPKGGHVPLIRWALQGSQDLEMNYYSAGRGALTHRRVTPISLEAETYLQAYCHLRKDERVFRLSRIGDLQPVGGWGRRRRNSKDEAPPDLGQMSLLGSSAPPDDEGDDR